jgi:Fe-S oxidoreductase
MVSEAYAEIFALPAEEERISLTTQRMQENPALYAALRQCCFCNHCTAHCPSGIIAVDEMRAWRELFSKANFMPPADSKIVMVDNEWHIFSAYRAIYGVAYPEFTTLSAAAEAPGSCDTLFFPGCSLVSYGSDVMRATAKWLTDSGVAWCYSDACCGSPLMSAGLFERAAAWRASIIDACVRAGIKRVVTVCPGCADELRTSAPDTLEFVPMPELMLELAAAREARGEASGFSPLSDIGAVTFFDSCHDRVDSRNGRAVRELVGKYLPQVKQLETAHTGRDNLCCGAGGAVSTFDPDISKRRIVRAIDETAGTGAAAAITACPTCSYTFAQELLAEPRDGFEALHYLELMFGLRIDWARVFAELGGMWSGEYGPWLMQTFY